MNILIVDDDTLDREIVKRALLAGEFDCTINEVSTVDRAEEICFTTQFDVILLDYRMPERDGIELLLEMRRKPLEEQRPIVMMSNSEDDKITQNCLKAGAQDFLLKHEISAGRLRRTIMQAQHRFELEQELKQSFVRAKTLAETDTLTGLANRYLFEETLKTTLANNERNENILSLLMFDLDNFKLINDSYGHSAGDNLLQALSQRLSDIIRTPDLFARIAGDQFAILQSNLLSPKESIRLVKRIQNCLKRPFYINDKEVNITISIGISISHGTKTTTEELLKHADIAMFRSKHNNRGGLSFFEPDMQKQIDRRSLVEHGLAQALRKEEFLLYYQPVFKTNPMSLYGFEALIRWHKDQVIVPPDEFIPIAEESQQIIEIGRWVIKEAVWQLAQWNAGRSKPLHMAINISAKQLKDETLPDYIEQQCIDQDISPTCFELELTETALTVDFQQSELIVIDKLRSLGFTFALDDFGTGYSSISHLLSFPLHTVKLDKSLMNNENDSIKGVSLITGLAKMLIALSVEIVAEGIECIEHELLCNTLKVDRLQGYYYSVPLAPDQIPTKFLNR